MAIKKGYCTNCNKHDESRRIFDVNSEARVCYCPHCGKKYRPKIVEKSIAEGHLDDFSNSLDDIIMERRGKRGG